MLVLGVVSHPEVWKNAGGFSNLKLPCEGGGILWVAWLFVVEKIWNVKKKTEIRLGSTFLFGPVWVT